ncbi:MAG: hypothetical protein C0410_11625 [Anaerolinea sp.]|nr:hypothetical protein [Anaerolinea sp.]
MFKKISAIIALVIFLALAGCEKEENMKDISQITVVSDAGSILPELQWHEAFIINKDTVTFTRNGFVDTSEVNAGSWGIPADAQTIALLFLELETVNLKSIERVEPIDPPDGGESSYYEITFENSKAFSLNFNPGVTYTNGELITHPLQVFLEKLQLPSDAINRYK